MEKINLWEKSKPNFVGRPKAFASPKALYNKACEYFKWIDENDWQEEKQMVVDKMVERVDVSHKVPYTMMGFLVYCGLSDRFMNQFKKNCPVEFYPVIEWVEGVIREQKFAGAAVGFFNANIISRDLGLVDKTSSENFNYNSVQLTVEDIKAINEALEQNY